MDLDKALTILADFHTRDNDYSGFTVHMVSSYHDAPQWTQHDYVEAWKTVRAHLHRQVDPQA